MWENLMRTPVLKGQKVRLTPEMKYKRQLEVESELLRWQREYDILQRDSSVRRATTNYHQRAVIRILRSELKEILTDLQVAASPANARHDDKVAGHLRDLIAEKRQKACKLRRVGAFIRDIDMQAVLANRSILALRAQLRSDVQNSQKVRDDQHTLEALENKLETATKRFCSTMATNRALRDEIDSLLQERAGFNKLWNRICGQLQKGKKFMLDLIEQATIAYNKREEWCQKLTALRSHAFAEFQSHTLEMTSLQRNINAQDSKIAFLKRKGQRRVMMDRILQEKQRRAEQRDLLQRQLAEYTRDLEAIYEFMGHDDMPSVVRKFVNIGDLNFSKFCYSIKLNEQIEELNGDLITLYERIDNATELTASFSRKQEDTLQTLGVLLEATTAEADQATNAFQQTDDTLNQVLDGIHDVFITCMCSRDPLIHLLGENDKPTRFNVLLYLKVLERRVNEILLTVYYKDTIELATPTHIQSQKMHKEIVTIEDVVQKDTCPLCVEQALVSDVIDSLQKAMSKDQICSNLAEAIELRGFNEKIHNVSGCHLPQSRAIIQKRFQ